MCYNNNSKKRRPLLFLIPLCTFKELTHHLTWWTSIDFHLNAGSSKHPSTIYTAYPLKVRRKLGPIPADFGRGCQSTARLKQRDEQQFTLTLTPMPSSRQRKPKCPNMVRICKLPSWLACLYSELSCCEVTVLTTAPLSKQGGMDRCFGLHPVCHHINNTHS